MAYAPFPIDKTLTAITIAYRNSRLIADRVLPRITVDTQEFSYLVYDLKDGYTVPDTKVGRTSRPNQVEFSAEEKTNSTNDHALDSPVPYADVANAPKNYNPRNRAAEATTNLIMLDREVRASHVVFGADSYAPDNVETLSGTSQWSDPASDPAKAIMDALDAMIVRANVGVLGRKTATTLRRHPKIIQAFHGNTGTEGMVPLQWLAEYLELEAIEVGEARVNTSRTGQTMALEPAWGPHAAFIHIDEFADSRNGITFGYTAQFRGRISGAIHDPHMGMRGGELIRVGESVKELSVAPDAGFLFLNATAA